jgi:hypothetical protein
LLPGAWPAASAPPVTTRGIPRHFSRHLTMASVAGGRGTVIGGGLIVSEGSKRIGAVQRIAFDVRVEIQAPCLSNRIRLEVTPRRGVIDSVEVVVQPPSGYWPGKRMNASTRPEKGTKANPSPATKAPAHGQLQDADRDVAASLATTIAPISASSDSVKFEERNLSCS